MSEYILGEIRDIIIQLNEIESRLRGEFSGIGTEKCADVIAYKIEMINAAKYKFIKESEKRES